ncbi:probable serine/threonine-protein kinase nek3 [Diprion similis]|uniref:probable serine/threonine-protein kinase nek3 n=1 Tax=Diprion similis TaxID=362088 RepID=UPI001EF79E21|nr:probable serine/threonine-protein kinase nek3 [Diprion similis]
MMMAPPQVVGVLLKKPGQREDSLTHPRVPPLDPQEIKIRGELYVENLGEQRMVTIRMGWLWVEGTPMRLPLRALNLRQATPSLCQPHDSALGFTLSNPQNGTLATFWADTEPIYWSWVRAIAAELVRQTPFRAQRCLNFLEILTICPRGPVPLPDSPTESRRRSRSELRSWFRNSSKEREVNSSITSEEYRRRARSELRGWSSNSSDEDVHGEFRSIPHILPKELPPTRPWASSESSEGSDDSLPWGGGQSSVDSADSVNGICTTVLPPPETKEQRIERYKEARRRENEARSRRVVEEDARRRKAWAEENNNIVSLTKLTRICHSAEIEKNVENNNNNNNNNNKNHNIVLLPSTNGVQATRRNGSVSREKSAKDVSSCSLTTVRRRSPESRTTTTTNGSILEGEKFEVIKSSLVKVPGNSVRFEEHRNLANSVKLISSQPKTDSVSGSVGERRSRARERRCVRDRGLTTLINHSSNVDTQVETICDRKERLAPVSSRIPIYQQVQTPALEVSATTLTSLPTLSLTRPSALKHRDTTLQPKSPTSFSLAPEPPEEAIARLLKRCQRVDHYVPVRDKLTLFESLSRLGGRLARSTEDLGRAKANPSPRGKQRARSLHDLNRAAKSVPVREMCRFFEGEKSTEETTGHVHIQRPRFCSDSALTSRSRTWSDAGVVANLTLSTPSSTYTPNKKSSTKSTGRRRQYAK